MSKLQVETISHTNNTTAMTIDSTGRVSNPTLPHFKLTKSDGHVGANSTIVWNNADRDTESAYSTSTGKYTIPLTGVWWMGVSGLSNNTDYIEINILINGTLRFNARNRDDGNTVSSSATINVAHYFTSGQEVHITTSADSSLYGTGSAYAYWTGYFIG